MRGNKLFGSVTVKLSLDIVTKRSTPPTSPESSLGLWAARSDRPTSSRAIVALRLRCAVLSRVNNSGNSTWAHQCEKVPRLDIEVDLVKYLDPLLSPRVDLAQPADLDKSTHTSPVRSCMGEQDIAYSTAGLEYSMNARIQGLKDRIRGSNAVPRGNSVIAHRSRGPLSGIARAVVSLGIEVFTGESLGTRTRLFG